MALTYSINISNGGLEDLDQSLPKLSINGEWFRINERCLGFRSSDELGFELSVLHDFNRFYTIHLDEEVDFESSLSFDIRANKFYDFYEMKTNLVRLLDEVLTIFGHKEVLALQNGDSEIAYYANNIAHLSGNDFWDQELKSIVSREISKKSWKLIDD